MTQKKQFSPLWAYVDGRKTKVGYGYQTKGGLLCVKGDKMLDRNKLARMLLDGLYIEMPQERTSSEPNTQDIAKPEPLRKAWK